MNQRLGDRSHQAAEFRAEVTSELREMRADMRAHFRWIEAARENAHREGLAIEFRVQSATEFADPPGSFDGAFCTAAFNHIPGRALRIETLRRLGRALTSGGALLLGVAYRRRLGLVSRTRVVDLLRVLGAKVFGPGKFSEPGDGWMREVSEAGASRAPVRGRGCGLPRP